MLTMMKSPVSLFVAVMLFLTPADAQEPAALPAHPSPPDLPVTEPAVTAIPETTISPLPSPTVSLHAVFDGHDDLLTLSAAMAAAQFEIRQSLSNKSDLIAALSRLVAGRCMRNLHKALVYTPDPKNKGCLEAIEYTLSVDPSNPEAVCARDGIDTASCREAFRQERTTSELLFKDTEGLWMRFQDDVRIQESVGGSASSKASTEFFQAVSAYKTENTPSNKARIAAAATTMLDRMCMTTRKIPNPSFDQERQAQEKALEKSAGKSGPGESAKEKYPTFNEMMSKLTGTPGPSSTPIPAVTSRFRLVSDNCRGAVNRTLEVLPEFPRAICHRDGFFSPSCVMAMRRQKYLESKSPAAATGGPSRPAAVRENPLQSF